MLEKWEKESTLMLMGGAETTTDTLDLNDFQSKAEPQKRTNSSGNSYDNLFN